MNACKHLENPLSSFRRCLRRCPLSPDVLSGSCPKKENWRIFGVPWCARHLQPRNMEGWHLTDKRQPSVVNPSLVYGAIYLGKASANWRLVLFADEVEHDPLRQFYGATDSICGQNESSTGIHKALQHNGKQTLAFFINTNTRWHSGSATSCMLSKTFFFSFLASSKAAEGNQCGGVFVVGSLGWDVPCTVYITWNPHSPV